MRIGLLFLVEFFFCIITIAFCCLHCQISVEMPCSDCDVGSCPVCEEPDNLQQPADREGHGGPCHDASTPERPTTAPSPVAAKKPKRGPAAHGSPRVGNGHTRRAFAPRTDAASADAAPCSRSAPPTPKTADRYGARGPRTAYAPYADPPDTDVPVYAASIASGARDAPAASAPPAAPPSTSDYTSVAAATAYTDKPAPPPLPPVRHLPGKANGDALPYLFVAPPSPYYGPLGCATLPWHAPDIHLPPIYSEPPYPYYPDAPGAYVRTPYAGWGFPSYATPPAAPAADPAPDPDAPRPPAPTYADTTGTYVHLPYASADPPACAAAPLYTPPTDYPDCAGYTALAKPPKPTLRATVTVGLASPYLYNCGRAADDPLFARSAIIRLGGAGTSEWDVCEPAVTTALGLPGVSLLYRSRKGSEAVRVSRGFGRRGMRLRAAGGRGRVSKGVARVVGDGWESGCETEAWAVGGGGA